MCLRSANISSLSKNQGLKNSIAYSNSDLLSESLVGWLCTVACYDSIVVTNEATGTISATTTCQQFAGQPAKEKHRIGHTIPGM